MLDRFGNCVPGIVGFAVLSCAFKTNGDNFQRLLKTICKHENAVSVKWKYYKIRRDKWLVITAHLY